MWGGTRVEHFLTDTGDEGDSPAPQPPSSLPVVFGAWLGFGPQSMTLNSSPLCKPPAPNPLSPVAPTSEPGPLPTVRGTLPVTQLLCASVSLSVQWR